MQNKCTALEKKHDILYCAPMIVILIVLAISVAAPLLEIKRLAISRVFYDILHNICHQMPTRSLWILSSNMALCARCTAIYIGLFISGIVLLHRIPNHCFIYGVALLLPCLIDGLTQLSGGRISNNFLRVLTGFPAGIGVGMIFYPLYFHIVTIFLKRGWNSNSAFLWRMKKSD